MFGRQKIKSGYTTARIPEPRAFRKGEMETLLAFVEKCAGRPLRQWEANVMEMLVKAVSENEAVHG